MKQLLSLLLFLTSTIYYSTASNRNATSQKLVNNQKTSETVTFKSEHLIIKQLSEHTYQHTSILITQSGGEVSCNGMIVLHEKEAIIFDTPPNKEAALQLIQVIADQFQSKIIALIPTHFHEDCIGSIGIFENNNIPIYATSLTLELLEKKGIILQNPVQEFDQHLELSLGSKKVYASYYGEGHTEDNIIGYFPEDSALFGGCLIKNLSSGKGYLGDANTDEWPKTVRLIKSEYPEARIVIPGHGKSGGTELLDYTIELFE